MLIIISGLTFDKVLAKVESIDQAREKVKHFITKIYPDEWEEIYKNIWSNGVHEIHFS